MAITHASVSIYDFSNLSKKLSQGKEDKRILGTHKKGRLLTLIFATD
jgi:hypothetical protein